MGAGLRIDGIDPAVVRDLWRAGLTDRQAAAEMGCSRPGLTKVRQRLGLPALHATPRRIDPAVFAAMHATGATDRSVARRCGVSRPAVSEFRRRRGLPANAGVGGGGPAAHATARGRRAALTARYGLPADLKPPQVRLVLALLDGPRPRAAWLAAARVRSCGASTDGGRRIEHVADLERRGLVARVRNHGAGSAGRTPDTYLLTVPALDLIGGAA